MFENIKTLADLNAARIRASSEEFADLVSINNAYNTARQRIVSERPPFNILHKVKVTPRECAQHAGIPVLGNCANMGTIQLTKKGFLV